MLDQLEPVEDKPEIYRPVQDWFYKPLILALVLLLLPLIRKLAQPLIERLNQKDSQTPEGNRQ